MIPSPTSPPLVDDAPPIDQAFLEHAHYVRRTAEAAKASLQTAWRALAQASKEFDALHQMDCGTDCCITPHADAEHEYEVADRAIRYLQRMAEMAVRGAVEMLIETDAAGLDEDGAQ